MDTKERDRQLKSMWLERMGADFDAFRAPERTATHEVRLADAAEYIAFQLGQINRKLDKLIGGRGD